MLLPATDCPRGAPYPCETWDSDARIATLDQMSPYVRRQSAATVTTQTTGVVTPPSFLTMSQAQTFHALVCPWTYSHERIRAILDASGITVLRQANPSEIVDFIATARTLPKVIITSIESGGLAIASTLRTVSETAHKFDVPPCCSSTTRASSRPPGLLCE